MESPEKSYSNKPGHEGLENIARVIHFGLTLFGILAWATGFWAGDYKRVGHPGFSIHRWLGLSFSFFLLMRVAYGVWGPDDYKFAQWVPYTKERLQAVWEDLSGLLRFKLPERPMHVGLSGLVQTFGLGAFAWMATTGSLMFFSLAPGHKARGLLHLLKELHEAAVWLIPIYLGIHIGAVLLHSLAGEQRWRRTFFLKD